MDIHKKFNSLQEYTDFFLELISWKSHKSLWKESDLPLLEPFFDFSNNRHLNNGPMTEEQKLSFDHYLKCRKDYADENVDMRDSIIGVNEYNLADAFCFKEIEDEDGNVLEYVLEDNDLEFPLVVTGYIDSDYDRSGSTSVCVIRFVTLKDFK